MYSTSRCTVKSLKLNFTVVAGAKVVSLSPGKLTSTSLIAELFRKLSDIKIKKVTIMLAKLVLQEILKLDIRCPPVSKIEKTGAVREPTLRHN